jgi:hypothetical protein
MPLAILHCGPAGAGKHCPVAAHPADSRKAQTRPPGQSASALHMPVPPASTAASSPASRALGPPGATALLQAPPAPISMATATGRADLYDLELPGERGIVMVASVGKAASRLSQGHDPCRIMENMRILGRILGGCLMAVGAAFVATALVEVAGGGDGHTTRGVYAFLVVFFSAVTFGGWQLWRASATAASPTTASPSALSAFEVEQRILAAAARSSGRVTVGEVAMTCRLPIARAKQTLDAMVVAGAAEMLLTDGGDPVYRIAGLLAESEKAEAEDPLADVLPGAGRLGR